MLLLGFVFQRHTFMKSNVQEETKLHFEAFLIIYKIFGKPIFLFPRSYF